VAVAQDAARTVQYHSQDIVPITPRSNTPPHCGAASEKIMEAATATRTSDCGCGWELLLRASGKPGISSNLNLITDKGNIYSFTLQEHSTSAAEPDLKVIIERRPVLDSRASGPAQFVPASNWSNPSCNWPRSSRTLPKQWMSIKAHIQRN